MKYLLWSVLAQLLAKPVIANWLIKRAQRTPYTLFITWRYQGTWGYLVDGVKIYWKTYLGLADDQDLPDMKKEKRS